MNKFVNCWSIGQCQNGQEIHKFTLENVKRKKRKEKAEQKSNRVFYLSSLFEKGQEENLLKL